MRAAAHAGNTELRGGAGEVDRSVRTVTGIVVVDIVVGDGSDLAHLFGFDRIGVGLRRHIELVHLPPSVRAGHGKHEFRSVEIELHIRNAFATFRLVERGEVAIGRNGGQHADCIRVARPTDAGIALPVLGQRVAPGALDQEQGVEVKQRIGEQGFLFEFRERLA